MAVSNRLEVTNVFEFFTDRKGKPLENGYIYIGAENLDPESNSIATYWDENLSISAGQPIRTLAGYPDYNGAAGSIYVDGVNYSITVRNKKRELVFTKLSVTLSASGSALNTVDTISDLVEVLTSKYTTIGVLGFYGIGDEGGGVYDYDATGSKTTHNGGTIIDPDIGVTPGDPGWWTPPVSGTGVWKRTESKNVNVMVFGGLEGIVEGIGANEITGIISTNQTLTGDLTSPANISIEQKITGIVSGAFTWTINGSYEAGRYTVKAAATTFIFGKGSIAEVYPEWFYISGAADWSAAVQEAINTSVFPGAICKPGAGIYDLGSTTIYFHYDAANNPNFPYTTISRNNIKFLGAGMEVAQTSATSISSSTVFTSTADPVFSLDEGGSLENTGVHIGEFFIGANNAGWAMILKSFSRECVIENIMIDQSNASGKGLQVLNTYLIDVRNIFIQGDSDVNRGNLGFQAYNPDQGGGLSLFRNITTKFFTIGMTIGSTVYSDGSSQSIAFKFDSCQQNFCDTGIDLCYNAVSTLIVNNYQEGMSSSGTSKGLLIRHGCVAPRIVNFYANVGPDYQIDIEPTGTNGCFDVRLEGLRLLVDSDSTAAIRAWNDQSQMTISGIITSTSAGVIGIDLNNDHRSTDIQIGFSGTTLTTELDITGITQGPRVYKEGTQVKYIDGVVVISDGNYQSWGDPGVASSWRWIKSGDNYELQSFVSGAWTKIAIFDNTPAASGNTAMFLYYNDGSTDDEERITLGVADSGGVGFKLLRVPNTH
jgi:hypothetical protein